MKSFCRSPNFSPVIFTNIRLYSSKSQSSTAPVIGKSLQQSCGKVSSSDQGSAGFSQLFRRFGHVETKFGKHTSFYSHRHLSTDSAETGTNKDASPTTDESLLKMLKAKVASDAQFRQDVAKIINNTSKPATSTNSTDAAQLNEKAKASSSRDASQNPNVNDKSSTSTAPPPLTSNQLWRLALRAGLPFFGFGLCDNVIMITVGDAIDATFGVTLGFSTLVAAGFGQAVSDGAGISIQGAIENASDKLGLPDPQISPEQQALSSTRLWTQGFRTLGIVLGCLVGVLLAMFADNGNRPRLVDSVLKTLPPQLKKDLLANKSYKSFSEGEYILRYGEDAPGMYMIMTGEAEIIGRDNKNLPMHIHTHGPGDAAGLMEITFGHQCVADVVASTDVRAVFIPKEHFMLVCGQEFLPRIKDDVARHVNEDDSYVAYRLRQFK